MEMQGLLLDSWSSPCVLQRSGISSPKYKALQVPVDTCILTSARVGLTNSSVLRASCTGATALCCAATDWSYHGLLKVTLAINRSYAQQSCSPTCSVFERHKSTRLHSIIHIILSSGRKASSKSSVRTGSAYHSLRVRCQLLTPATDIHVNYCGVPCIQGEVA